MQPSLSSKIYINFNPENYTPIRGVDRQELPINWGGGGGCE